MAVKQSQRAAADKWDEKNMAYQTVKVKRVLLDDFKAACKARGDKVNTVLREAMENYVDGRGLDRYDWMIIKTALEQDITHCESMANDNKLSAQQRTNERRAAEMMRPCYEKVLAIYETLSDGQK